MGIDYSAVAGVRGDCAQETHALLLRRPGARGFVGTCIIRGGRSLVNGQEISGIELPWSHHVWAVLPDGELIDPTVSGLLPEALAKYYEPPAPLSDLPAAMVSGATAQAEVLASLDCEPCKADVQAGQLLYLPGCRVMAGPRWHRLSRKSMHGRGFTASDLLPMLSQGRPQGFAMEASHG